VRSENTRILNLSGGLKMKKILCVVLMAVMVTLSLAAGPKKDAGPKQLNIVHCLIREFQYGLAEAAGARAAADEYGAKFTYFAPINFPDSAAQVEHIESAIAMGADLIIIDAVAADVATPLAQKAIDMGITITCSNSGVANGVGLGSWATDQVAAAGIAADEMAKAIGGKGKVAVIGYGKGAASSEIRAYAFVEYMQKNHPNVQVLPVEWAATADAIGSADVARAYLAANPDLAGMYAGNSMTTEGMIVGVKELGRAGKIILMGYDSNDAIRAGIRDGSLHACIMQSPYNMGYQAAKAGLEYITKGVKPSGAWFKDTGVLLMTKANIDSPEAQLIMKEW
jgi:ribose transport system substrate-binding protein